MQGQLDPQAHKGQLAQRVQMVRQGRKVHKVMLARQVQQGHKVLQGQLV